MAKTVDDLTTGDILKVISSKFQSYGNYIALHDRDYFNPVHAEEDNRRYGDPIPERMFSAKQISRILTLIKKHHLSRELFGRYVGIELNGRFYRAYFTKAFCREVGLGV